MRISRKLASALSTKMGTQMGEHSQDARESTKLCLDSAVQRCRRVVYPIVLALYALQVRHRCALGV